MAGAAMHYTVLLDNFEGPLDLLLQLVEREKLDVREVSLSQVTGSFVEHMRTVELRPAEVSQFVSVAVQLILTKSKRVLPTNDTSPEEPEDDIAQKLERYQHYRTLARELEQRASSPYLLRTPKTSMLRAHGATYDISQAKLTEVWKQLRASKKDGTGPKHEVRLKKASLQSVLTKLIASLSSARELSLVRLIEIAPSQHEAVLSFLAVLELAKQNRALIELAQDDTIMIRPIPSGASV